jgi:hypothetical protein
MQPKLSELIAQFVPADSGTVDERVERGLVLEELANRVLNRYQCCIVLT